jgi:hypothetical protein
MTRFLFLFTWLLGPRFFPLYSLLCARDAVPVLLCNRRVAACSGVAGARHTESVSSHAEAKSDSPEHSGSDA